MKSATVEICYNGGDYCFRCPDCGSLNINGEETAEKCPDCGAEFAVPEIQLCDCKDNEEDEEKIFQTGEGFNDRGTAPQCGVDCHC